MNDYIIWIVLVALVWFIWTCLYGGRISRFFVDGIVKVFLAVIVLGWILGTFDILRKLLEFIGLILLDISNIFR